MLKMKNEKRTGRKERQVLTRAVESLFAVESLIALGALGCLGRADMCEQMTVNSLLALFDILLFLLLLSVLFLHKWNNRN